MVEYLSPPIRDTYPLLCSPPRPLVLQPTRSFGIALVASCRPISKIGKGPLSGTKHQSLRFPSEDNGSQTGKCRRDRNDA